MLDHGVQKVGNYRLIRLLGQGSSAEVYLGEHMHMNTSCAIKLLYSHLENDSLEEFYHEAHLITHLIHPNIVKLLEFGAVGSTPFLIMNYAFNGTLRQRYSKGVVLPLPIIISYVKQIADGLQYAHDEKLTHLDVKPENVLLGEHDQVLLSDFSITYVTQSIQEITGTVAYMAPEQFEGKPCPASDQYALGIVVYEWLCGSPPFHGSFIELARQHKLAPPPSLSKKYPIIPPALERVVLTALAKDPKQRFESIQAFATAFQQVCREEHLDQSTLSAPINLTNQTAQLAATNTAQILPTVAVPPREQTLQPTNTTSHPSPLLHQHTVGTLRKGLYQPLSAYRPSRRTVIKGLAGMAIVSSLAWLLFQKTHTPPPVGTVLCTHSGSSFPCSWSPDGTRIASVGANNSVQVWDSVSGSTVLTYRGHTDGVLTLTWSPDSKYIASAGGKISDKPIYEGDNTVRIWASATGKDIFHYRGHSQAVETVTWSPDGVRIASGSDDGSVQVWDATTGGNVFTYRVHSSIEGAFPQRIAWAPNGRWIASLVSYDRTLQVWDATTGGIILIYRPYAGPVYDLTWSPDSRYVAASFGDGTVHVVDVAVGSKILTYQGHVDHTKETKPVNSVSWAPNGIYIASSGKDVQIWNSTTGKRVYTFQGDSQLERHAVRWSSGVYGTRWSPDSRRITSNQQWSDGQEFLTEVLVWQAL